MESERGGRAVRPWSRRRWLRLVGTVLVFLGLVLLGGSITYFVYGFKARSELGSLGYTPFPTSDGSGFSAYEGPPEMGELALARDSNGQAPEPGETSLDGVPAWAVWSRMAYPGEVLRARYWGRPLAYEPRSVLEKALAEGFQAVNPEDVPPVGSLPPAIRIRIPAIDVDSKVEELAIVDLGDSRAYGTPKHVVGHIPESANSGENGTGWFFGHLESPIRGEGSVFRDLPRIPELLRESEEVYAILDSANASFLYRLTSSEVLPEQALHTYDTGEPTIRLVTCVPALYYDYRLVIWGELTGVKRG